MPDNSGMSETTRRYMSERLSRLMRESQDLDTLERVAKRAGVSYGTVRRIKTNDPTDVQLGNVEDVAAAFGMTLIEFVSPYDSKAELSAEERQAIKNLRELDHDAAHDIFRQIARMATMQKAANRAIRLRDGDEMAG